LSSGKISAVGVAWLVALVTYFAVSANEARANGFLATDLSEHEIAITSDFNGKDLLLFGTTGDPVLSGVSGPAPEIDVIIVVHGPEVPMKIWRRERVAGIWVNSQPVQFDNVPGYYAVAANRPLADITTEPYLRSNNIGADNLVLISVEDVPVEEKAELRKAILGNRGDAGLYTLNEAAITFPDGRLFRSAIHFPANVPVGDYQVIVRLFINGLEIDRSYSVVPVGKSGMGRQIYAMAQNQSLLYGIAAVFIAILAGWLAAVVFRQK
jgi:uncharacterized protein (TIGR02186 family)